MALPRHVAIIMDGNGRWARKRLLPRVAGHRAGVTPVRVCIEQCVRQDIAALTLFAFSSENWARPPEEVGSLMGLFLDALDREIDELQSNGVRLRFIGERHNLSQVLQQRISSAESRTAGNSRLALQIAVSYGGRWDLVEAARLLAQRCAAGTLLPQDIDESLLSSTLSVSDLPDPDLFIRTGGEQRISNFLLWNLAYTELYFTDQLWPDFDAASFQIALDWFASRNRRFGLTGEQAGAGS
ncbi:MAG: polyprenyl diphosphate synthase [Proteobacteria bacterium]|nr:polyprenyl diphosphate synthase [Pseudomonadota bacterium]